MTSRSEARLARKLAVLEHVKAFSAEHGYGPTFRQIATAIGTTSASYAFDLVAELVDEGMLTRSGPAMRRTIEVISRVPTAADFARYTDADMEQIAALHTAERRGRMDRALGVRA